MSGLQKNKLSQEDVQNIIAEVKAGIPKIAVARKYGVDHSIIYYYLKKLRLNFPPKKPAIVYLNKKDYAEKWYQKNKERILKYQKEYRHKTKLSKKAKGKSYKELLAIENEKRKMKGLYSFKMPTAGFYK